MRLVALMCGIAAPGLVMFLKDHRAESIERAVVAVTEIVGIGLNISTLPEVALGAGIGVDYGICPLPALATWLVRSRASV